ncbi:MAG: SH3 domain-containing protein [Clostridia bacterium]
MQKYTINKFLCTLLAAVLCSIGFAALDDYPKAVASAQSAQGQLNLDDPETYRRINEFLCCGYLNAKHPYASSTIDSYRYFAWEYAIIYDAYAINDGYGPFELANGKRHYFEYNGDPYDMRISKRYIEQLVKEYLDIDLVIDKKDQRFFSSTGSVSELLYQDEEFFYECAVWWCGECVYDSVFADSLTYIGNDTYRVHFTTVSGAFDTDPREACAMSIEDARKKYMAWTSYGSHSGAAIIRHDDSAPHGFYLDSITVDRSTPEYEEDPEPAPTRTYYIVNCESYVSLREHPETDAARIARVPLGATVTWLDDTINNFCRVNYNDQNGFILRRYLSESRPSFETPQYGGDDGVSAGENRPSGSGQLSPFMVCASSVLSDQYGYYEIEHLWDDRTDTTWAEAAHGNGEGEYLEFKFDLSSPLQLTGFTIWAGYQKNSNIYYKNSRPKRVYLDAGDNRYTITLSDEMEPQTIRISDCYLGTGDNCVTLTLDTFYGGNKYADTCISEIRFWAQ